MEKQSTRGIMIGHLRDRMKEIKKANKDEVKREETEQRILAISKKLH